MSNKVRKTVSFNITNPHDVDMLEHIEEKNFSGYVKELIAADIERKNKKVVKSNNGSIKIFL